MSNSPPAPLPFGDAPVWRQVLTLGWPALVQQFLNFVVLVYDAWLAGQYKPTTGGHVAAQSAQTTALYLSWFVSSYAILVGVGGTALVARACGAGDRRAAAHAANQSLLLALVLGTLAGAAGVLGAAPLVALLGLSGDAARFAADYLRPLFAVLPVHMIGTAGIACLVGAGDTRTGLWVMGGVAVLNMPLTTAFLFGFGPVPSLEFTGIAVGTAVSQLLGGLAVLAVLLRGRSGLRVRPGLLRPDSRLLARLLRVSIPAGVDSLLVAAGQLCFLGVVNGLGETASSAHGIALRWEAISYLLGTAFGTAAMAMVGQNLGAGLPHRAARSARAAFGLCCVVMCLCGILFVALAYPMFAFFCPYEAQRPVIDAGVPVLRFIAVAMPPLAATIVFTQALRGAGDTRVPVLFTLVGFFVVRLPLAYLLTRPPFDLGLRGAWTAMIVDVYARGLFVSLRFASGRWSRITV